MHAIGANANFELPRAGESVMGLVSMATNKKFVKKFAKEIAKEVAKKLAKKPSGKASKPAKKASKKPRKKPSAKLGEAPAQEEQAEK